MWEVIVGDERVNTTLCCSISRGGPGHGEDPVHVLLGDKRKNKLRNPSSCKASLLLLHVPGPGVQLQVPGRCWSQPHRCLRPPPTPPPPRLAAPSTALPYGRSRTQERPQQGSEVASGPQSPWCHWWGGSGGTCRVLSGCAREQHHRQTLLRL